MNIDNLVAVSGLPGIFKIATTRPNGLIIEDYDTGKRKFAPTRKHQFTPLETVSIYTDMDSAPLADVFKSMKEQASDNPPVETNSSSSELTAYFSKILPDYDKDRVMVSDIKKLIKWFHFLDKRGLLEAEKKSEEEE